MLFNAYEFILLFWPLTLILFFQIGRLKQIRLATLWLVVASFFFYGWWNPAYLLLLIASILVNYCLGMALSSARFSQAVRKGVLVAGIALNLAALGYFKYASFFADNINAVLKADFNVGTILLPLGISFFTFQQVAYLIDAYAGKTKEYRFLDYCLFVSFFPQLIAGPIVHHNDMMGQFSRSSTYRLNDENIAVGLSIFSMGLFKKVMLADTIATFATPVFNAAASGTVLTFWDGWIGALAYTLQLYFDFSGYSDMAIGIARTFGIKLPLNFNSPYKADSISDFWRRWHITLSHFLRDYLYIPLGGSRRGSLIRYRNLIITMTLGGLWHGAGWTYVVWGLLHGVYLVLHRVWTQWCKSLGQPRLFARPISVLITFVAVMVSWVFFRAATLTAAFSILKSMAGLNGLSLPASLGGKLGVLSSAGIRFEGLSSGNFVTVSALGWIVVLLAIVWCMPNSQQWMANYEPALHFQPEVQAEAEPVGNARALSSPRSYRQKLSDLVVYGVRKLSTLRWKPSIQWALIYSSLSYWTVLSLAKESEFIYFQF
ncbi:MAG: MBOAT family protein [Cyanobacteria bacterium P01_A01_bin.116]